MKKNKENVALVLGITGQDGSYLAELLLEKDYKVHGLIRRSSTKEENLSRIQHIEDKITLHYGDLTDFSSLTKIIDDIKPNEIYNLAAQSDVRISFDQPILTAEVNYMGFMNILEVVKSLDLSSYTKIYQASSSEMFGNTINKNGLNERDKFEPVSPYGISKLASHILADVYVKSYDMFICCGILFNHESRRRGLNFVTNKVVKQAVEIKHGQREFINVGNINAFRDWGHAKDYVEAMWLMMQKDDPGDYVIATNMAYSVRTFIIKTLKSLDLIENDNEVDDFIKIDKNLFRSNELNVLRGDYTKAKQKLNWSPKYTLNDIILEMIDYWKSKLIRTINEK